MILMPQNFDMLYRCHCVLKTSCETTTDRRSEQKQQKYMLLGVTAAATTVVVVVVVVVVVAVLFACSLFHSYITTSVHLFIHHLSVYKEGPNMCPLSNQYNCLL